MNGTRQESGKFRAARVPLDYYKYYKTPDRLERGKRGLLGLAILLAAAWGGLGLVWSDYGVTTYSRGPVAAVHATWENKCDACHTSFMPLSGEAWLSPLLDSAHTSAQRCETCHGGPPHHAIQKPEQTATCAGCHRDHRGREASLARLPDRDCTGCHTSLDASLIAGAATSFQKAVSRFDDDDNHHPMFELPAKDPGKLKFNHQKHLAAGMDCQFSLDRVEQGYHGRYQSAKGSSLVQLDCQSCHRLDNADFKPQTVSGIPIDSVFPARSAGAYLLPITYENQCAGCHPLTFEKGKAVPHRLQPDQVRDYLKGFYTDQLLQENPQLFQRAVTVRPLPGPLPEKAQLLRKTIEDKVASAEKRLFSQNTCLECHFTERDAKRVPSRIVPTQVPQVWFEHARFNHTAHRALDCKACHEAASQSTTHEDVLIPNKAACVACHAPSHGFGGGARFDCVECHRYHNGDKTGPMQGVGAAVRGVPNDQKLNTRQFLSGARKEPAP